MPEFDAKDQEIALARAARRDLVPGPRVGDFVILKDGRTWRFSHDWGEDIQISENGSFYLGYGYISFSGSLYPPILKIDLIDTGEKKDGAVWFFHHNHSMAHNGVHTTIPCRVYKQKG